MANGERIGTQRGESKLGGIISLAVFLAFCYAVFNVAPVYMADYQLGDKIMEVCRLRALDDHVKDLLMREVRERDLHEFLNKESFKIETRENKRRIRVQYQRTVKILPGWTRTFSFSHDVDQPFF
jgi:hypothetical protein